MSETNKTNKVIVIVIHDRHCEDDISVVKFSDAAIDAAKKDDYFAYYVVKEVQESVSIPA